MNTELTPPKYTYLSTWPTNSILYGSQIFVVENFCIKAFVLHNLIFKINLWISIHFMKVQRHITEYIVANFKSTCSLLTKHYKPLRSAESFTQQIFYIKIEMPKLVSHGQALFCEGALMLVITCSISASICTDRLTWSLAHMVTWSMQDGMVAFCAGINLT